MQEHYLDHANPTNPPPASNSTTATLDEDWLLIAGIVLAFS